MAKMPPPPLVPSTHISQNHQPLAPSRAVHASSSAAMGDQTRGVNLGGALDMEDGRDLGEVSGGGEAKRSELNLKKEPCKVITIILYNTS